MITYGAEAMILTKGEGEKLRKFEKKFVRKIYGPKKLVKEVYQSLMNSEVQEKLQGGDIVKAIKTQRRRKIAKVVTEWKPDFRRARGRPKSRWEEQVRGHEKAKNPHHLQEKNPGSEVMEEIHKRRKDERWIRIGAKETVKEIITN